MGLYIRIQETRMSRQFHSPACRTGCFGGKGTSIVRRGKAGLSKKLRFRIWDLRTRVKDSGFSAHGGWGLGMRISGVEGPASAGALFDDTGRASRSGCSEIVVTGARTTGDAWMPLDGCHGWTMKPFSSRARIRL